MEFLGTNLYTLTLLISSTAILILGIYISQLFDDSIKWLSVIMISMSIWGFFYGIEITQNDLETILFLTRIEYLGISMAPAAWVLFCLHYTSYQNSAKKWIFPLVIGFAVFNYIIMITNDLHQLHYKSTWLFNSGNLVLIGFEKGPWYYVIVAYCYSFYLLGTAILLRRIRFSNFHFKLQTRLLMLGGFFPILINFFYQNSIFISQKGIDSTPFAFLLSYILLGIAVLKFNLLNLKPIARNKILEAMSRGVMVFDHREKLVDFNLAGKKFSPNPEKVKIGQRAEKIFGSKPEILQLLKNSEQKTLEIRIPNSTGVIVQKIEAQPILEGNPVISGVMLLIDDITKEIEISERLHQQALELRQLNSLKDKLFGIISHDLRGPIVGVKELIQMTKNGLVSKNEFFEIIPEISKSLENVTILFDNLLAWSSMQLIGEQIQNQKIILKNLIENQKNLLERIAKEKSIQIEISGINDTWMVEGDQNMLELVFRNIISNAIKFSKPNQIVNIFGEIISNQYRICVRDFGLGISEENLKKLRDASPFTTRGSNNEPGTGLGMILVREFLNKNKGTLEIESTLGEGSLFCIKLNILDKVVLDLPT